MRNKRKILTSQLLRSNFPRWRRLNPVWILSLAPVILNSLAIHTKPSTALSMGGMQVSDANGWNACIKSIAIFSEFPVGANDWCLRRPLYPLIAGFEFQLFQSTATLLVFNSFLFGLVSVWSYIHVRHFLGRFLGLFLLGYQWIYWERFASTQTMTESFGLILGTIALGFVCKEFKIQSFQNIAYLATTISFINLVRPGNLLVYILPFLLLLGTRYSKSRIQLTLFLVAVISIPHIFIRLVAKLVGINNFLHGGNSWATLYGLIVGNQDWTAAYSISGAKNVANEIELWNLVREASLKSLSENPFDLVFNTLANVTYFLTKQVPFFPTTSVFSYIPRFVYLFLMLFFAWKLFMFSKKKTVAIQVRLVVVVTICSTFLFYGILLKSDPFRALSSTQALFLFLCLLTLSKTRKIEKDKKFSKTKELHCLPKGVVSSTIPTLFCIVLIVISFKQFDSPMLVPRNNCAVEGEFEIVDGTLEYKNVSEIELPGRYWWEDVISKLPNGYLIQGLSVGAGREVLQINLFIPGEVPLSSSILMDACFKVLDNSELKSELDQITFSEASLRRALKD
jgi:hypothetical protein